MFRVRQVAAMFVVEELRWGTWHIIEELYSWEQAKEAATEYQCDID